MILISFRLRAWPVVPWTRSLPRHLPVWPAREKPGAVTRPSFQRNCRGYLFVPESRYTVKIFFPNVFFPSVFFPSVLSRRFVEECRST
jgi:hypothetical protein